MHFILLELKLTLNTRNQFPLMLVSWTGQSPRLSSCTLVTTVWSCFTKRRHSVSKHSTVSSSYYLWDTSKLPVEANRSNFIKLRGHTHSYQSQKHKCSSHLTGGLTLRSPITVFKASYSSTSVKSEARVLVCFTVAADIFMCLQSVYN